MANENVYINDLSEATSASDSDKMVIEGTETKRISFTNLCNAVKTKLGLKTGATSSVVNNDTTTSGGYVADARIVKTHGDEIDALANKVFSYVGQASSTALNVNLTAGTYLVLTSHSNSAVVGMYLVIASDTAVTSYTLITPTGASLTASMSGRSFRISTPGASVTVYKCKIA